MSLSSLVRVPLFINGVLIIPGFIPLNLILGENSTTQNFMNEERAAFVVPYIECPGENFELPPIEDIKTTEELFKNLFFFIKSLNNST